MRCLLLIPAGLVVTVGCIVNGGSTSTRPPKPFHPSITVWDRESCQEHTFVSVTIANGDNANMRKQQEVWFCSHQWNDIFIAKSAELLESNGMLPVQWYPGHDYDRAFYSAIPKPASNFAKVFDGGRLLLPTAAEVDSMRSDYPSLPPSKAFSAVTSHISLKDVATIRKPLPQVYTANVDHPSVRLVTDLGTQFSLGDTLLLIQSGLDGRLFDDMNRAQQMGVHLEGYGTWMNPAAFSVAVMLQLMLHDAAGEREAHGLKALQDLEVLYISDDFPDSSGVLVHREGYYDPRTSRIYVHRKGNVTVPPSPSRKIVSNIVSNVLPAALEHEYFHYLFYRPEIAGSGFILEGEATANGERLHQGIVAGTTLTKNPGDRLRQLVDKIESDPGSLRRDEWEEYEKRENDFISHQPMTKVQCRSLRLVYRHHIVAQEPFDLKTLLTMNLSDFTRSDPALSYAEAWAVYHVDVIEKRQWDKDIDRIYKSSASSSGGVSTDDVLLKKISRQTLQWVKTHEEANDGLCEP